MIKTYALTITFLFVGCGSGSMSVPDYCYDQNCLDLNSDHTELSKIEMAEGMAAASGNVGSSQATDIALELLDRDDALYTRLKYHPLESREVQRVRDFLGGIRVRVTDEWQTLEVERPWSGYWYPKYKKDLFEGFRSPLQKLDRVLAELGAPSRSAEFERRAYGNGYADRWEGLCDAWAMAAVSSEEPKQAKRVGSVSFSISDQKAILTLLHRQADKKSFGVTYAGNAETDGTFQDLRPEAFHGLVVAQLNKGKAVVIDEDPGIEVWSKPVFKYRWKLEKTDTPEILAGRAYVYYVTHRDQRKNDLTTSRDTVKMELEFRLYIDPQDRRREGYKVLWGEWIGASRTFHPDTVFFPASRQGARSLNHEIDNRLDLVRSIVGLNSKKHVF